MASKFGMWWQKIKQHWAAIVVVVIALVVVIVLIFIGYRFEWTGFARKTLWDWLQLLIIPLVLAVTALLFNFANTRTEQKIALDKQRQDLLQAYLDCMAELLLEKQLGTSATEEVRNVAQVRTITILTQLDARRISYVFTFLREARLRSVVSLKDADLRRVNWSQANLSGANLSEANLSGANLSRSYLRGANLSRITGLLDANLSGADLSEATLIGANLFGADLSGANLSGANLSPSVLFGANLRKADLSRANLRQTFLIGANLRKADLTNANLSNADLTEANLNRAKVTEEQLKEAKSLQGATMPDGSKHP